MKLNRPVPFTMDSVLEEPAYDRFIGCTRSSCPITSIPIGSVS